jgi:osmotically-inducible protein OsmY
MTEGGGEATASEVRAAIGSETRVRPVGHLAVACDGGIVVVEGEVADVASKKLALERAAAVPGVTGIVDRLRVRPASPMDDQAVRRHVRDALLQEPALAALRLFEVVQGERRLVRDIDEAVGRIDIRVDQQVVTLDGEVPSLAHKRIAGVLAWWVPGSRDVINGLGVTADEPESDAETTDAVRAALEKDPFVNASQIKVFTRRSAVRLEGVVPTAEERDMAEYDAWYVFGVDAVDNRIEVRPFSAA